MADPFSAAAMGAGFSSLAIGSLPAAMSMVQDLPFYKSLRPAKLDAMANEKLDTVLETLSKNGAQMRPKERAELLRLFWRLKGKVKTSAEERKQRKFWDSLTKLGEARTKSQVILARVTILEEAVKIASEKGILRKELQETMAAAADDPIIVDKRLGNLKRGAYPPGRLPSRLTLSNLSLAWSPVDLGEAGSPISTMNDEVDDGAGLASVNDEEVLTRVDTTDNGQSSKLRDELDSEIAEIPSLPK